MAISDRRVNAEAAPERRGFALYVGLSESKARQNGVELGELVDTLRRDIVGHVPLAESHALAVVAPVGARGRDLDIVLRATVERPPEQNESTPATHDRIKRVGVVIDLARHRVLIDDRDIALTFKEFSLLQVLVRHDGMTLDREVLRDAIATGDDGDVNKRTIDVHIRRLRVKFGDYPDVIRTIHGKGYRFDPRSDVTVLRSSTPSSDLI